VEHRTPGNLRAFIQAKLRNLRTGAMFVDRFRSPDPIEKSRSTKSTWSSSTTTATTTTS
jgi:translation elongation factor P/translation initiation factor 5A